MPFITVEDGDWGSSRVQDVHAIVQSVCDVFRLDASVDLPDSIILRSSKSLGPRALIERGPNNEHIILVNARDCLWAMLAFQFAHEYCHVFSDHYNVPLNNRYRWLEESFCELASLYALQRMGIIWQSQPPYDSWRSYADSLTSYATDRINNVKHFDSANRFREWLDSNIDRMTLDSVVRELNNVVAVHLLAFFQQSPDAWLAVAQINARPNLTGNLDTYFAAWSNATDGAPAVGGIAKLMNVPTQNAT